MASELSSFIEKELEQRGINASDKRRLISDSGPSAQRPQQERTLRDMKTSRVGRYSCVIGLIMLIVVVWIVLMSTGQSEPKSDNSGFSMSTIGQPDDKQQLKSSISMDGIGKIQMKSPEVEDQNPAQFQTPMQEPSPSTQPENTISLPEFEKAEQPSTVPNPSPEVITPSPEIEKPDQKQKSPSPEIEKPNKSSNNTEVSGLKLNMSEPVAESDKKLAVEDDSKEAVTPSPEVSNKHKEKEKEKSPKPNAIVKPSRDRITPASRLHQGASVRGMVLQSDIRHGG